MALPRRIGAVAEEATLRARRDVAVARGDARTTAKIEARLARVLASYSVNYASAIALGESALASDDADDLRSDVVRWLELTGQHARAADVLVSGSSGEIPWERAAVLRIRAGDGHAALAALTRAAAVPRSEALAHELRGSIAAWAPDCVSSESAAAAFLEASEVRHQSGSREGRALNLVRAWVVAPREPRVVEALRRAHEEDPSLCDFAVLRRLALRGLSEDEPRGPWGDAPIEEPCARLIDAIDRGQHRSLDGDGGRDFDATLAHCEAPEWLAARLELRIWNGSSDADPRALARLAAGVLDDGDRSVLALVAALEGALDDEAIVELEAAAREARVSRSAGRVIAARLAAIASKWGAAAALERARSAWGALRDAGAGAPDGDASAEAALSELEEALAARAWGRAAELSSELVRRGVDASLFETLAAECSHRATAPDGRAGDAVPPGGSTTALYRVLARACARGAHSPPKECAPLVRGGSRPAVASALAVWFLERGVVLELVEEERAAIGRTLAASGGAVARASAAAHASALAYDAPSLRALGSAVMVVPAIAVPLIAALQRIGDRDGALSLAQRSVLVTPGDAGTLGTLLSVASGEGVSRRAHDAVGWALAQPVPGGQMAPLLAQWLDSLPAADASSWSSVARRALDALGPRDEGLRRAITDLAMAAGDPGLAAEADARSIATLEHAASRVDACKRVVSLEIDREDRARAVRALAAAQRDGLDAVDLARALEKLGAGALDPDAELVWLTLRVAEASASHDAAERVARLRLLGAARWDLAGDARGAVRAWIDASGLAPRRGADMLRSTLQAFAGIGALDLLERAAREEESDRRLRARLLVAAGQLALEAREPDRAMGLAEDALRSDRSLGSALRVAESAATAGADGRRLSGLYEHAAQLALGRFGRRAAHHRAARYFAARGASGDALHHAAEAFLAVPSEGGTLVLLAKAADAAGTPQYAARLLAQVADATPSLATRVAWLERAAALSGTDDEGHRQRLDLLLRALAASPATRHVRGIGESVAALIVGGEDHELLRLRLARATGALEGRVEGPDGARLWIAVAVIWASAFTDGTLALDAGARAFSADGDVDEFADLIPWVECMARSEQAETRVESLAAAALSPYSNTGTAALQWLEAMATSLDVVRVAAVLAVRGAERAERVTVERVEGARAKIARLEDGALSAELEGRLAALEARDMLSVRRSGSAEGGGVARELPQARDELSWESVAPPDVGASEADPLPPAPARLGFGAQVAVATERGTGEATPRADVARLEPPRDAGARAVVSEEDDAQVRLLATAEPGESAELLLRRAAVASDAGDAAEAEVLWRRALDLDPMNDEAYRALDAALEGREAFAELIELLASRQRALVQRGQGGALVRAVALRRVALLEQRLGRVEQARSELRDLSAAHPESTAVLSYLADMSERAGDLGAAAEALASLAALTLEDDSQGRAAIQLRRVRVLLAAGDLVDARAIVMDTLASDPSSREAAELRTEIARRGGDPRELGDALEAAVDTVIWGIDAQGAMLVEAAQAAARAHEPELALARARRAAELVPTSPAAQLFARGLEYRLRGPGEAEAASKTVADLHRIEGALTVEDVALRAFLLAEALDVLAETAAAVELLERAKLTAPREALVALALAERYHREGRAREALVEYALVVSGSLLGLRSMEAVCAEVHALAIAQEDGDIARAALARARREGADPRVVVRRELEIELRLGTRARAIELGRELCVELAAATSEDLATLGRLLLAPDASAEQCAEGERHMRAAIGRAGDATHAAALAEELEALLSTNVSHPPPRVRSWLPSSSDSEWPVDERGPSAAASLERGRLLLTRGSRDDARRALADALARGEVEAADELEALIGVDERSERVRLRLIAAELAPGDQARLVRLREAAAEDGHDNHVRALDHVLASLAGESGAGSVPPLGEQRAQPGLAAVLLRPSRGLVTAALRIVWERASSEFACLLTDEGVTGIDAVAAGPTSALSRLLEQSARLLDVPHARLYVHRSERTQEIRVVRTTPPSIVCGSQASDDAAGRFRLGFALGSALADHVLLVTLGESELFRVWSALRAAFGRERDMGSLGPGVAGLAGKLWELVPQGQQRDLQTALGAMDSEGLLLDDAVRAARRSSARFGLFLSGDLRAALSCLSASGVIAAGGSGVQGLVATDPFATDLYRLAIRPDFADARWALAAGSGSRVP